jgi:hypothetical protein
MTQAPTFAAIRTEFELAFQKLIAVAENYPEALQTKAGASGKASAREVLAAFSGWLVEALRRYSRYERGTGHVQYNKDAFNEVSVWLRREADYEMILQELRDRFQKLGHLAQNLTEAQIQHEPRYAEWLTDLAKEARDHTTQLEEFAKQ